jgi:hypothetical protein
MSDSQVTQWFEGRPPSIGWWDTKSKAFANDSVEIRLWWDGFHWRASPNSKGHAFLYVYCWRGLAEQPINLY